MGCSFLRNYNGSDSIEVGNLGPLDERAWVIQERLLSPRLLYFEDKQIAWRCPTTYCLKESFPTPASQESVMVDNEPDPGGFGYVNSRPCGLSTAFHGAESVTRRKWAADNIWNRTLQAYTKAKLTEGKDKLRAIKGVGDCLAAYKDDIYLDGYFSKALLKGLCFRFWGVTRTAVYHPERAPSWSWAAWDSEEGIGYDSSDPAPGEMLAARVIDLRGETSLPSTLHCIGRLIPIKWEKIELDMFKNMSDRCNRVYANGRYDAHLLIEPDAIRESGSSHTGFWLPISAQAISGIFAASYIRGIALKRLQNGTYSRIGIFHLSYDPFKEPKEGNEIDTKSGWQYFLDNYGRAKPRLISLV